MTLDRWTVYRYQLPQLDVQSIRRLDDVLEVNSRRGVFRLICDETANVDDELLPMLDALRDPRSTLWSAVRDHTADAPELIPMLRVLDHLGLIRDCGPVDASPAHAAIGHAVQVWSSRLGRDLAAGPGHMIAMVERLADRLGEPCVRRAAIVEEPNFFVMTLLLQARYLRSDAPAVLALLVAGLRAAVRRARLGDISAWWFGISDMPAYADEDWSCGLVELPVVRRYLAAVGQLLRDAARPDAARRVRSRRDPVEPISGINFMVDLEADVPRLLAELGRPPGSEVIEDRATARRTIKAAFLQEYLVTCRFAECLAPLLSRRFSDPLRDAVHRYFAEETGHETFEREYCLRLGYSDDEVDRAEPLPLHLAFVDILSALARESPIALFCASMFTEGQLSTRHMLASLAMRAAPDEPALLEAIGDRGFVNDDDDADADHAAAGRNWMSRVPLVTARIQREIGELIPYLAELNWRRWALLVTSCTT